MDLSLEIPQTSRTLEATSRTDPKRLPVEDVSPPQERSLAPYIHQAQPQGEDDA